MCVGDSSFHHNLLVLAELSELRGEEHGVVVDSHPLYSEVEGFDGDDNSLPPACCLRLRLHQEAEYGGGLVARRS